MASSGKLACLSMSSTDLSQLLHKHSTSEGEKEIVNLGAVDAVEANENPCTKEGEHDLHSKFDYYEFMEFNRLRNLLQEVEKLDNYEFQMLPPLVLNEENEVAPENAGFEFYVSRFEALYGEIDKSSPLKVFPILNSMRSSMIKMNSAPMPKEQILDLLADEGIVVKNTKEGSNELHRIINERFPAHIQTQFLWVDPSAVEGDWFNLPRPDLTKTRLKNLRNFKTKELAADELSNIIQAEMEEEEADRAHSKSCLTSKSERGQHSLKVAYQIRRSTSCPFGPCERHVREETRAEFLKGNVAEQVDAGTDSETIFPGSAGEMMEQLMSNEDMEFVVDSKDSIESYRERLKLYTCEALQNLHRYDPKFDLCYRPPYRIFSSLSGRDFKGIPKMLSYSMLCILNECPLGITENQFWSKFEKSKEYLPDLPQLKYQALIKYHAEEIYFIKPLKLPRLIFPNFLEGLIDPDVILKRIWHAILSLFNTSSAIDVETIFPTLKEWYGFGFDSRDWGFRSNKNFINFCIDLFGLKNIMAIHEVPSIEGARENSAQYLMIDLKVPRSVLETNQDVSLCTGEESELPNILQECRLDDQVPGPSSRMNMERLGMHLEELSEDANSAGHQGQNQD